MSTIPLQGPVTSDPQAQQEVTGEVLISDLIREIEQIPRGSWVAILAFIRIFRANLGQAAQTPDEQWVQALEMAKTPNAERGQALRDLLQSWVDEEDGQEQRETWAFLRQALDDDRLSNRPLFP
jgi:hypothetical protein